jgi:hypothetical protein
MAAPSAGSWLDILLKQVLGSSATANPIKGSLNLTPAGLSGEQFQSEISAVAVSDGQRFTLSSGGGGTLQISTASTLPAEAPELLERFTYGNAPVEVSPNQVAWNSQSVASFGSLVAVALSPSDYSTNAGRGVVRFYRANADGVLTFLRDVNVGYLPDGIAFNSTGTKLIVANEGEPTTNYTVDRAGSIGIISITKPLGRPSFSYAELDFAGLTLPEGVRISGPAGTTQATDIEPEYVAVNGNFAYVTLQENNAVAKVNLTSNTIEAIFALGSVDFSKQLVDISDRDDALGAGALIKPVLGNNVLGMRMPDGIAAYNLGSKSYFITANEGDGRDYGSYLDEVRRAGPGSRLKTLAELATAPFTAFGSRSISLFDASNGALRWDSGNTLQSLAIAHGIYDDGRSDDKSTEPEGVVTATLNGRTYAIVGTERTTKSMLAVFDVTDPTKVSFVTSAVLPASLSPEGLALVQGASSPSGKPMLVVSNEVSNTLDYLDLQELVSSKGVNAGAFAKTMLKDVAGGDKLTISSLLTNGEVVNGLTAGSSVYTPAGIFDGMAAYDNNDGTYSLLVNHELGSTASYQYQVQVKAGSAPLTTQNVAGGRISRFVVAKDLDGNAANGFQSGMLAGGLAYSQVISPNASFTLGSGINRFCSANLAPAGQFEGRGFVDRLYLTGEETSNGRFFALDPTGSGKLYHVPAFGLGGWESAVQVDTGSANTVATLLFDDTSGTPNYLYMWVGTKTAGSSNLLARNGIGAGNGSLYAWKASTIANTPAGVAGVALNTAIDGSWVKLGTGAQISALTSASALRTLASNAGAMQFTRIEDGDVGPSGKRVAFTTTGGSGTDLYGNVQVLDLSSSFGTNGLLAAGANTSMKVLVDGDRLTGTSALNGLRNPDGLAWSGNSLYVQEDRSVPAGTAAGNFGSQEASIWKVDAITGTRQRWAQIDRSAVPTAYGQSDSVPTDIGNWESSGIFDVSAMYGASTGSYFLADVQAHSLTNGNLVGSQYLTEGGQIDLIRVAPTV